MTRYVIVKAPGGGGLGDCIKALLVAAWYADLSDRTLVVDWRGGVYADNGYDCFDDFFQLKNLSVAKQIPTSINVLPIAWQDRLDSSLHELWTEKYFDSWDRQIASTEYSADLTILDCSADVLVVWDFSLLRAVAQTQGMVGLSDIAIYQKLADRYLALSDEFDQRLSLKLRKANIEPKACIGVHVRATNEFYANKGGGSWSKRKKAIRKLIRGGQTLFLATDNCSVEQQFSSEFANTKVLPKWFGAAGDPLHLNADAPSKRKILEEALSDTVVLGRCSAFIPTPLSSFSELVQILAPGEIPVLNSYDDGLLRRIVRRFQSFLK